MKPSRELVDKLREMARAGTTIRAMVDAIHCHLGTEDGLSLVADRYLMEAFHLNLSQVRAIEGCSRLGGAAYSDDEIDRLILPRIEATKNLWASD